MLYQWGTRYSSELTKAIKQVHVTKIWHTKLLKYPMASGEKTAAERSA